MSVWMPLVYSGAAVGGQREAERLNMETLTSLPPYLLPDTPAGKSYAYEVGKKKRAVYFSRPPACRYNFIKLGVQHPFQPPWRKLVQAWEPGVQDSFVLRNVDQLKRLVRLTDGDGPDGGEETKAKRKADVSSGGNVPKKLKVNKRQECLADSHPREPHSESHDIEHLEQLNKGCLVMVKLVLQHKGTLEPQAMICLPQEEDIEARESVQPGANKEGPTEPAHEDPQHDHRVKMKDEHSKIRVL